MSKTQLIDAVRQYRDHAKRRNRSYGEQISTLLGLWDAAVTSGSADAAEKARQKEWARDFIAREYIPVDRGFEIPAVS